MFKTLYQILPTHNKTRHPDKISAMADFKQEAKSAEEPMKEGK